LTAPIDEPPGTKTPGGPGTEDIWLLRRKGPLGPQRPSEIRV